MLDLRRLVSDLPLAPAPPPAPASSPAARGLWRTVDLLALLAVIGCLGFAALAILVLGLSGEGWLVAAGFVGGSVAALGGASLSHLAHRVATSTRRSAPDGDQRPRIA